MLCVVAVSAVSIVGVWKVMPLEFEVLCWVCRLGSYAPLYLRCGLVSLLCHPPTDTISQCHRVTRAVLLAVFILQIGGKPGLATLVMAVCVGLLVQNWDSGLDLLNLGLELMGVSSDSTHPPSPAGRREYNTGLILDGLRSCCRCCPFHFFVVGRCNIGNNCGMFPSSSFSSIA